MLTTPTPFYDDGQITIFHGDALQIAPLLHQIGRPAMWFCDWPYRITPGSNSAGRMHGGIWDPSVYDNSGDMFATLPLRAKTLAPMIRSLRANADLYLMVNDKYIHAGLNAFRGNRVGFHNMLMWNRGTKTPNKWGMKSFEFILYGWQGKARTWTDKGMGVMFDDAPVPAHLKAHPTQKPPSLIRKFIEQSTGPGELVIDPCMGVGSTLVAAQAAGRRAIGIELDLTYCQSAVHWLTHGTPVLDGQLGMFAA